MPKRRYLLEELGENMLQVSNMVHSRESVVDGIVVNKEVDSFVRVYASGYNIGRLMQLSGGASKLLWFILGSICYGDNYVVLNVSRFMKKAGVSSMTSYRAYVRELIDMNILARTNVVDVYYFDHNLFFKGSRVNNLDSALVVNSNG